MRLIQRRFLLALVVLVAALAVAALVPGRRLVAQDNGITLWDLGSQPVSGTSWQFNGDFSIGAGAWESVTISNYGYCWSGPNDPKAGTAHAGGVYWFTELTPQMPSGSGISYTGTLKQRGMMGTVTVTTTDNGSGPDTNLQVSISGDELGFFQDNSLEVCLLGSS